MSNTLEERCRQLMIQRKFEQCQKEIETAMAENPHCAIPHNLMGILMEKEIQPCTCHEAFSCCLCARSYLCSCTV